VELKNSSHAERGKYCENLVKDLLIKSGWKLFAQRQMVCGVEVDLVFQRDSVLLVVEVKSLSSWEWLSHRLTVRQRRRLDRVVMALASRYNCPVHFQLAVVDKKQSVKFFDEFG